MSYNWDDFETENDTFAHNSLHFFANLNRSRHERKKQHVEPDQITDKENLPQSPRKRHNLRSQIVQVESQDNAETVKESANKDQIITPIGSNEEVKLELIDEVDQISTQMDKVTIPVIAKSKNNENHFLVPNEVANNQIDEPNKVLRSKPNITTPSKWVYSAAPKTGTQAPKAYEFHNVYKSKRQEALRKQREEERKMREFNSRPVPNFKQKPTPVNVHFVTTPITPQVLKRSKESIKKKIEKLEEMKHQNQPPEMKSEPKDLQPRPYNLRCEIRLQERKKFDEAVQHAQEQKQKHEEEKRKQQEKADIKEIRKATTFKARPNPFKQ